jgi:DNA-binding NarL/FixJ family response regulator
LIIDDIHFLDESSADVVLQAMSTRAVALIATAVADAPLTGPVRQLVDDGFVEVIALQPFDRLAVERVACSLLGGPAAPSTAELLWRWSDGLPGALHEIVDIGRRESAFRLVNGCWWWEGPPPLSTDMPAYVQRHVDLLSGDARDALDFVVLGDQLEVDIVERLVNASSLIDLERASLIESVLVNDTMIVRCRGTHVARRRRSTMPALRRRSLARRLLGALPAPSTPSEITRSASLHAFAGQTFDAQVVEQATSILRLTDPHSSQSLAEAQHRASPSVTTAADLVDSRIEVGDVAGANHMLAEASSLAVTPADTRRLTEAAFAVALFGDSDPAAARRVLERHRHGEVGTHADAELSLSLDALAFLLSARPDTAEALARQAIAAESSEPSRLRAGVTVVASLMMRGQTDAARTAAEKLLDPARRLTGVMPSAFGMLRAEMAFIHLWRGELTTVPGAHPLTGRWPSPPLAEEEIDRQMDWPLMAGIVSHLRGEHADAVTSLNEAVVQQAQGKRIFHAEAGAWLVVALCDAGRTTDAVRALRQLPERHLAVLPGLHDWASGVVASARGRTAEATERLAAAAAEARSVGAHLIEARYLVELADRCGDDGFVGRIDELEQLVDAPLLAALCRGAIARLKGDSAALLHGAETLDALGLHHRAKAMARDAQSAAIASGEDDLARAARRARRTMRSDPTPTVDTVGGLSRRELEVARLAAGGMTDREIAARLVLSVRTIESHLASGYRKLAVSSRDDLALALG